MKSDRQILIKIYHFERWESGRDYNSGGAEFLRYLITLAHVPERQARWRLKTNSAAIWDSRSTQHYAVMD